MTKITKNILQINHGLKPDEVQFIEKYSKQLPQFLKTYIYGLDDGKQSGLGYIYDVKVDFSMGLGDMIKRGNYQNVAEYPNENYITVKDFQLLREQAGENFKYSFIMRILYYSRTIQYQEILDSMELQNLRPANAVEALAFGAQYPEPQKFHSHIALGAVFMPYNDGRGVPYALCLDRSFDGGRELRGTGIGFKHNQQEEDSGYWHGCRFLAVSKFIPYPPKS